MVEKYEYEIQQAEAEISWFIDLMRREGVRSYLEIGSQAGGSLWRIARSLPRGSRVVSIDKPQAHLKSQGSLEACGRKLRELGYDAHVFIGDSTDAAIIEKVRPLAPFDCVLIDGNHTLAYVTKDFETYGAMGRLVAFHDVGWRRPQREGRLPIEVREFWESVKGSYRHEELCTCPKDNGIGVLWRA